MLSITATTRQRDGNDTNPRAVKKPSRRCGLQAAPRSIERVEKKHRKSREEAMPTGDAGVSPAVSLEQTV